jgi:hypothetical protein
LVVWEKYRCVRLRDEGAKKSGDKEGDKEEGKVAIEAAHALGRPDVVQTRHHRPIAARLGHHAAEHDACRHLHRPYVEKNKWRVNSALGGSWSRGTERFYMQRGCPRRWLCGSQCRGRHDGGSAGRAISPPVRMRAQVQLCVRACECVSCVSYT